MAGAADCQPSLQEALSWKAASLPSSAWGGMRGGFTRGQTSPIGSAIRPAENSGSYPTQVERPQFQGWAHPGIKLFSACPGTYSSFRNYSLL